MHFLRQSFQKSPEYQRLIRTLDTDKALYCHGLVTESLGAFLSVLFEEKKRTLLFVAEDEKKADEIYRQLEAIDSNIVERLFPDDINFYNIEALDRKNRRHRLFLYDLLLSRPLIVIVPARELLRRTLRKARFKKQCMILQADQNYDLTDLTSHLIRSGYERTSLVTGPGQFSVRGGIIDIFSLSEAYPVRVEFFDDEIDSMRYFDSENQRSLEKTDLYHIITAREMMPDENLKNVLIERIQKEIARCQDQVLYGVDKDKLFEKYSQIVDDLQSGYLPKNMDLILPFLYKNETGSLFDYIPSDTIVILDDLTRVYDHLDQSLQQLSEDISHQMENGEIFPGKDHFVRPLRDIIDDFKSVTTLNITALLKRTRLLDPSQVIGFDTTQAPAFNHRFDQFAERVKEYLLSGYRVVLCSKEEQHDDWANKVAQDYDLTFFSVAAEDGLRAGILYRYPHDLVSGFEWREDKLLVLTKQELYGITGRRSTKKRKRRSGQAILHTEDLNIGDYVVHENHGIGQYEGMQQIEMNGIVKDFLVIQYRGNDRLYIPTDQMDLVQKYIGNNDRKPKLNKLSDITWQRTKQKTKAAIDEIAEDLVELYAKRAKLKGHAFKPDTPWQKEFEDAFIYEETFGQIRSIEEIKKDMEKPLPMDRILLGDVGYGKTEVAIRAAFKAIMDDKQVAFLVPTTILAKQHYETIVRRFQDYPIKVEMLSRFKTPKQQKQIISDLNKGFCDLVVGTHKILSKSVHFKDLGLLIVDEEQRFGVRHKESIKKLKENIDVLTLSATPIPRTLQMGLSGIRDLSVLDEPPEERFPTNTYVTAYKEDLIRDVIRRELSRGGQVYFVYNRVEQIDKMAKDIENLVPDARIAVAHGQMPERELEDIMMDFEEGQIDILVSTTIIETGMDIQNCNTMIVYNADYMGLSQLYQLKGRIGRSDRTSYCYFTYQSGKVLSEISEKRLKAIKDFSDFGSGFKIAMRDLELRGAGNLLGESQHGHIASVGYDLYVKMLEEAVKKIKGIRTYDHKIDVDIKQNGYIPDRYISDHNEKIAMYKKISAIENDEDYSDLVEELIDRFGDIPKSVQNIMDICYMKALGQRLQIGAIKQKGQDIQLIFESGHSPDEEVLRYLIREHSGLSLRPSEPFEMCVPFSDDLKPVMRLLEDLEQWSQRSIEKSR